MRDEILKIAEQQMLRGGYEHLNFGHIAEQLQTTRANVHYHFKNKESLAMEVVERFALDRETEIKKILLTHKDDFSKIALNLEDYFWNFASEHGPCTCICSQIIRNPDAPKALLEFSKSHFLRMTQMVEESVRAAVKAKKIKSGVKPEVVSRELAALINGMGGLLNIFENTDDAKAHLGGILKEWIKNYKA